MLWNAVFGPAGSSDERRTELIDSIRLHGSMLGPRHIYGQNNDKAQFFVIIGDSESWNKTSGDYPYKPGAVLDPKGVRLVAETDLAEYINEHIITDQDMLDYARSHIGDDGYPDEEFFEIFYDEEVTLVFIHRSHFADKMEPNQDGFYYLQGLLNKTRDPFYATHPGCQISKTITQSNVEKFRDYEIKVPLTPVVREAYNKECARVGRTPLG